MDYAITFILGVVIGAAVAVVISIVRAKSNAQQMQQAFAALAAEALDANSRRLAESAGATLDSKKQLIDQTLATVSERLTKMAEYFQRLESDRRHDVGALSTSIASLSTTTGKLHQMLASTQRRGAWGERMAADVLRLAGLAEGVNFTCQSSEAAVTGRPDFTFMLPQGLKVNMDVKFPLDAYKAYVDAADDAGRAEQLKSLLAAVRGHVKAVASRGYIDPQAPTVPYVLVFLASEQVFSLVMEADRDLIDQALSQKVVLCSPLTLYAMLAVIRQTAEHANLLKTADDVLNLLVEVRKQWEAYKESMNKMGDKLADAKNEYDKLVSTRTNMLDRPMGKIENLRTARQLPHGEA
ncbi:MAG: DNA recombination protein RmuC [Planctomycetaceae bacterium]|nr:DNA recombination protein RmuC [Planctomycetaceae bacterium]